jgi:hypothetical protein
MSASRYGIRSVIVLCGIVVFPRSSFADQSEAMKQRFFNEAPNAWEEYRLYSKRLQGIVEKTIIIEGQVHSVTHVEYKSNPRCKMVLTQSLPPGDSQGEVFSCNSLYGFNLKRNTNDSPWILADLQIGTLQVGPKGWDDFPALRLCISTQLYELVELIRQPNFRVVHAEPIQRNGIGLCKIDFVSQQTSGTLLLDPNRFWTVSRSTIREESSNQIIVARQDIELLSATVKYPIPKRWVLNKDLEDKRGKTKVAQVICEFDLKDVSQPPNDNEFTLSAFGLPEPMGILQLEKPSRTWLWLLEGAVCAGLLAVLFAWLKRRQSTANSAKT